MLTDWLPRRNVLTIDCEDMLKNARSESKLISVSPESCS